MGQLTPQLTNTGTDMMLKALQGDGIIFTKIAIGDGNDPGETLAVTDLDHNRISVVITEMTRAANYVLLTGRYDNNNINSGFYMKELGVYAKNVSDGAEHLYAYRYADTDVDYVPSISSGRVIETEISIIVAVGNSENISAAISEGTGYVNLADFNSHKDNKNNPHNVTKEQLGLKNVETVPISQMQPVWEDIDTLENITTNMTMGDILARVAQAIKNFKNHLTAKNPHSITPEGIQAAAKTHKHNISDLTDYPLPVTHGGTGVDSLAKLKTFIVDTVGTGGEGQTFEPFTLTIAGKEYTIRGGENIEVDLGSEVAKTYGDVTDTLDWAYDWWLNNITGYLEKYESGNNKVKYSRIPVEAGEEYRITGWFPQSRPICAVYDTNGTVMTWEAQYIPNVNNTMYTTRIIVIPRYASYMIIVNYNVIYGRDEDDYCVQRKEAGHTSITNIKSTGAYINTFIYYNADQTAISYTFARYNDKCLTYILQTNDSDMNRNIYLYIDAANRLWLVVQTGKIDLGIIDTNRHTFRIGDGVVYLDGVAKGTLNSTQLDFAATDTPIVFGTGCLSYGVQIEQSGKLVRDYIPAKSSDGEYGMYDKVTGAFSRLGNGA